MGGKVLVPTFEFVQKLTAARLAADTMGVPTILVARTDAHGASFVMAGGDPVDAAYLAGGRSPEGFLEFRCGIEAAIARALAYAPYADMLWCETSEPDLDEARAFAEAIQARYPRKLLAYNCSPSFNWQRTLDERTIGSFQRELGAMGYKFQFVTLAGFHTLNYSMFDLALRYKSEGMTAYADFQQQEFAREADGYTATRHQREVGAGYFDDVQMVVTGGMALTTALSGSTEEAQFAGR